MPSDSQFWFTLVELELEIYRKNSDVNHPIYVDVRLSPNVSLQVSNVVAPSCSYGALKEAVISRTAPTVGQWIRQMFQRAKLRNKKLPELLREMQLLRGAPLSDDALLGEQWFQRLPPQLRPLPSAARKYSVQETAEIIDDTMLHFRLDFSALNIFWFPEPSANLHRTN